MSDDETELDDVMEFPQEQRDDDTRWIVLFPDDYQNFARDPEGNLGIRVDRQQAAEVTTLGAETLARLSHQDRSPENTIKQMIDGLQQAIDDE